MLDAEVLHTFYVIGQSPERDGQNQMETNPVNLRIASLQKQLEIENKVSTWGCNDMVKTMPQYIVIHYSVL